MIHWVLILSDHRKLFCSDHMFNLLKINAGKCVAIIIINKDFCDGNNGEKCRLAGSLCSPCDDQ